MGGGPLTLGSDFWILAQGAACLGATQPGNLSTTVHASDATEVTEAPVA